MECDFNYLYHAYKYGIQGAADEINCDPSTVSRAVQDAETALGYPLFERRSGGKLEPLPVMHDFYRTTVAPAVEGLAKFKTLGRAGKRGALLRLGATETIVRAYLTPIIAQLEREYPALRIQIFLGNADCVYQWLKDKVIELAVIATDEPPRGWLWREFIKVTPVLVTLEGSTFPGLDAVLAREEIPHRLVCPPECEGVSRLFARFLEERVKSWDVTVVSGSTGLVPWMISAPDMVGLSVAVKALERPGLVRHPLPVPPLLVGAMWRGQPTPLLSGVMDLIAKTAPQYQALLQPPPSIPQNSKPADVTPKPQRRRRRGA